MKVIFNQSSLVFAQAAPLEVTISSVAGDPLGKVVSFATNAENATIYYTTDGSTPTTSSAQYVEPFTIYYTKTIKVLAVAGSSSATATQEVTVDSTVIFDGSLTGGPNDGSGTPTALSDTVSISVGTTLVYLINAFSYDGSNPARGKSIVLCKSDGSGAAKTGIASGAGEAGSYWNTLPKPIVYVKDNISTAYAVTGIKYYAESQVGNTTINVTVVKFAPAS